MSQASDDPGELRKCLTEAVGINLGEHKRKLRQPFPKDVLGAVSKLKEEPCELSEDETRCVSLIMYALQQEKGLSQVDVNLLEKAVRIYLSLIDEMYRSLGFERIVWIPELVKCLEAFENVRVTDEELSVLRAKFSLSKIFRPQTEVLFKTAMISGSRNALRFPT